MKNQSIIIISAMSYDHIIGTKDGMPWSIQEEYSQYLNFIKGQSVIMGRRSFEIFGEDLTSKRVFVVSRSMEENAGIKVERSLEEAIQSAAEYPEEIFIAGGGSIYKQAIPMANWMYLSYIKGEYSGIAYFPEFDETEWEVVERMDHDQFEFVKYKRKA